MDSFLGDLRTAVRSLRRSGIAYAAVVTLAVGIGGLCAIFGVVDLTLLRPLPVAHEEQMLRLREGVRQPAATVDAVNIGGPHFQQIAAQSRTLAAIPAMSARAIALISGDLRHLERSDPHHGRGRIRSPQREPPPDHAGPARDQPARHSRSG